MKRSLKDIKMRKFFLILIIYFFSSRDAFAEDPLINKLEGFFFEDKTKLPLFVSRLGNTLIFDFCLYSEEKDKKKDKKIEFYKFKANINENTQSVEMKHDKKTFFVYNLKLVDKDNISYTKDNITHEIDHGKVYFIYISKDFSTLYTMFDSHNQTFTRIDSNEIDFIYSKPLSDLYLYLKKNNSLKFSELNVFFQSLPPEVRFYQMKSENIMIYLALSSIFEKNSVVLDVTKDIIENIHNSPLESEEKNAFLAYYYSGKNIETANRF
ncbi:MAG: hypothetical protein AABZ74_01850, partial [Cyanobacteriota bacterium]